MPVAAPTQIYDAITADYERSFELGYGLQYPDGHVVRFHKKILQFELKMNGGRLLDYGCGNGVHAEYFANNGYEVFGCDISRHAIDQCKKRLPKYANNFHVVENVPDLTKHFKGPFDLIVSNQVFYYLTDDDFGKLLDQMYAMMNPGGVMFATMMPPTNHYHTLVKNKVGEMSHVVFEGRLTGSEAYINFKTAKETVAFFAKHGFRKLHMGFYTQMVREDEGPTDHDIFVGVKA